MKRASLKKIVMYGVAALLLAGYLYVLYVSVHPKVTQDYRMRYLEEGYFYGDGDRAE